MTEFRGRVTAAREDGDHVILTVKEEEERMSYYPRREATLTIRPYYARHFGVGREVRVVITPAR